MADRSDTLSPPKRVNTGDPGAHDLGTCDKTDPSTRPPGSWSMANNTRPAPAVESSESDDHFSDAQSAPSESQRNSPIPRTRVEKVSDEPSYGEVPGTDAYRLREGDAEPDEIAIIPEGDKKPASDEEESHSPGGKTIPKTVVEESPDQEGSTTHPEKKHRSDPPPDLILKADGKVEDGSSATGTDV